MSRYTRDGEREDEWTDREWAGCWGGYKVQRDEKGLWIETLFPQGGSLVHSFKDVNLIKDIYSSFRRFVYKDLEFFSSSPALAPHDFWLKKKKKHSWLLRFYNRNVFKKQGCQMTSTLSASCIHRILWNII